MDCLEFENQLQDLLDRREDPRASALQLHASECVACGELLTGAATLLHGVHVWRKSLPAVQLVDRILSACDLINLGQIDVGSVVVEHARPIDGGDVRVNRSVPEKVQPGIRAWGLVAASAAALCFMFWSASAQKISQTGPRGYASSRGLKSKLDPIASAKPDLGTVLASAGKAYSHLAQETAVAAQDFALLMPSSGFFRSAELPRAGVKAPASDSRGLLPENIYPVGDSVENALQFLWQAVPGVEKSAS
ncbi:MAG: hypothetical protein JWM11_749 [Planctomycetaceae bacterium]|nr:hypothetical protein [Planctomycetaceae bacterium]